MKVISKDEYNEQVMRPPAGIRDLNAIQMPGGLVILADDGFPLYQLRLLEDGATLEVRTPYICKVGERAIDSRMIIDPRGSNEIILQRPEYK